MYKKIILLTDYNGLPWNSWTIATQNGVCTRRYMYNFTRKK